MRSLKVVHVFRAPVGGLFRHVRDLAKAQAAMGHEVGIICDSATGGPSADNAFDSLRDICALGIHRLEMSRMPGLGDAVCARRVGALCHEHNTHIIHGHGAKGGVYARLAASRAGAKAVYTPHGGTLHYSWKSPHGAIFLGAEKILLSRTDGLIFVCNFEREAFESKIGIGGRMNAIVHNGLGGNEFQPVEVRTDASDLLFIGELRMLKGVDVLLRAIAHSDRLAQITLTIVGDGPDRATFERLTHDLGLTGRVAFAGAKPARQAFELGRLLVVPSRAESFPYIVLEAIAAQKPIIASRVGGIPEILDPHALVPPDDTAALQQALIGALDNVVELDAQALDRADKLRRTFTIDQMADSISGFYRDILRTPPKTGFA